MSGLTGFPVKSMTHETHRDHSDALQGSYVGRVREWGQVKLFGLDDGISNTGKHAYFSSRIWWCIPVRPVLRSTT